MDKITLYNILIKARNIQSENVINWMQENPNKSFIDCMIELSGANIIPVVDNKY